jgi:hypothetical protein
MVFRQFRWIATPALAAALATMIAPRPAGAQDRSPDPAHTTIVTGRLLDADGKPVPGGRVVVVAEHWARFERPLGVYSHNDLPLTFRATGPVRTDGEGRFRIEAPVGPARPSWNVLVHAAADGHGLATVELAKGKSVQDVPIKLDREYVVRGRLIDTQGQPADGAVVRPILQTGLGTTVETLTTTDSPPYANPLISAVTADDKGRFLIRGFGKDKVWIEITHERFATQRMHAQPAPRGDTKETPFSLVGARVVEGRITYGKLGKPATGARVVAVTGYDNVVPTRADDDGHYSLNPFPGDSFYLTVFPPDGQPYLVWKQGLSFAQAARLETDIALERGVLVRGRVDESPSGRPVPEALLLHRRRNANNPFTKGGLELWDWCHGVLQAAVTAADGSFQVAVPPGPGHLFVIGGTHDFVHVETSVGEFEYGRPSMIRNYPDAVIPLDLKPESETQNVKATLRRGVTLKARVFTPDGHPAVKFTAISRSYIPTGFELFQASWNAMECRDGELILPGCDPEKGGSISLYDLEHSLGTTLNFTGAQASGPPLTVTLEPCGAAAVRLLDAMGKPLTGRQPEIHIVLSPGTVMASLVSTGKDDKELEGDWIMWGNFHRDRNNDLKTDALGRVTIPALIPGALYQITSNEAKFDMRQGLPKNEFRVRAGETLKLPDFVIDR